MSAHSFPSLTSDSSSIPSRSSENHDSSHDTHVQTVSSGSRASNHHLSLKTPETDSEILQLRNRVSKLEQDKFVLGDYAAELQSRIRHLERERMEHINDAGDRRELESARGKVASKEASAVRTSLSRPSTPTEQSRGTAGPHSVLYYRPSSSLSATTATSTKRALTHHASLRETPSSNLSQLAISLPTTRFRLVPKRSARPEPLESVLIDTREPSPPRGSRRDCQHESTTPTRRRVQAMYGSTSLGAVPSLNGDGPSNYAMNDHEPHILRDAHSTCIPNLKPPHEHTRPGRDSGTKRTPFTSKLDSIILTSKLFPMPSSRSKLPPTPVSPDHLKVDSHIAAIPLTHPASSSSPLPGNVFLDSPPNKAVKVKAPRMGKQSLSHSLGLEENRHPEVISRGEDRKGSFKSRGRVSFSDRLFSSSSDRGDESETDVDPVGRLWGSWGRKRRPPASLAFNVEKHAASTSSAPPSAFTSRFTRAQTEDSGTSEEKIERRKSIAAGCLRSFMVGYSEREKTHPTERRERRVLRRSTSESRRSRSRSPSALASTDRVPAEHGSVGIPAKTKDEKRIITPSRVGSPMPKGRSFELQAGEELERTNSLRSAGRWGQRGRGFAKELTRRRTIHPMFSFERPGSTGASTSSSRRDGGRADDERTADERDRQSAVDRTNVGKPSRRTQAAPDRALLSPSEFGVSHSHAHSQAHTQDDSLRCGTSGLTHTESRSAPRGPMMRAHRGMQSHGTFAFEPAAAVVCAPRSAPPVGGDPAFVRGESLSRRTGTRVVRTLSSADGHGKVMSEPAKRRTVASGQGREYLNFCEELKGVLGDGEDWSSFKKYIRRFDIEVLSAEVLLQRVKRLIDGARSVDAATKLRLYERFEKIVHDTLEEQDILGS